MPDSQRVHLGRVVSMRQVPEGLEVVLDSGRRLVIPQRPGRPAAVGPTPTADPGGPAQPQGA